MKKVISLLALALLCSKLDAARVTLKDGSIVDAPDSVRIINDLSRDVQINKTVGCFDGYVTQECPLVASGDLLFKNSAVIDELKVLVDNKEYTVSYPSVSTYAPQMRYHYDVNREITAEFTYKLSALIDAAVKKSRSKLHEFAPACHVIVNEAEQAWLHINKN